MAGKIFFIADTHFGHEAMIRFENRPFKDTADMEAKLIQNWNETVDPEDSVFMLGDFAFGDKDTVTRLCHALNGKKHWSSETMTTIRRSGIGNVVSTRPVRGRSLSKGSGFCPMNRCILMKIWPMPISTDMFMAIRLIKTTAASPSVSVWNVMITVP